MEHKILAPVDFEQQSLNNLNWASFYAQKSNSQVLLLHIMEQSNLLERLFKEEDLEQKIIEQTKKEIHELGLKIFGDKVTFQSTVTRGKPYEEIEEISDELNPLMVILGRNEKENSSKKYIGSNTLHIINEIDYPVVTIFGKNEPQNVQNKILVPLDITKDCGEQITIAYEFAKFFDASIKLLTVNYKQSPAHEANMLVQLNKIKKYFEEHNIQTESEIIEAKKEEIAQIVDQKSKEMNPLFVIIMVRDESNLKNLIIGTVAQQIINTCNAPVMCIKPWDKEQQQSPIIESIIDPLKIF